MIARIDGYSAATTADAWGADLLVTYQVFDPKNGPWDDKTGALLALKSATVEVGTDAATVTRDDIEAAVKAAETTVDTVEWLDMQLPSEGAEPLPDGEIIVPAWAQV